MGLEDGGTEEILRPSAEIDADADAVTIMRDVFGSMALVVCGATRDHRILAVATIAGALLLLTVMMNDDE